MSKQVEIQVINPDWMHAILVKFMNRYFESVLMNEIPISEIDAKFKTELTGLISQAHATFLQKVWCVIVTLIIILLILSNSMEFYKTNAVFKTIIMILSALIFGWFVNLFDKHETFKVAKNWCDDTIKNMTYNFSNIPANTIMFVADGELFFIPDHKEISNYFTSINETILEKFEQQIVLLNDLNFKCKIEDVPIKELIIKKVMYYDENNKLSNIEYKDLDNDEISVTKECLNV